MSVPGRVWGLRVLSLAIAVALWFVLSYEKRETRSEKVVQTSVSYSSRPENLLILNPGQTVDVILSGPRQAVQRATPADVSVTVDLADAVPGVVSLNLTPQNVLLPQGLTVAAIQPSTIEVHLDEEVTRLLPVEPRITGEPAAGAIMGQPEVLPPRVAVRGPRSEIRRLTSLDTGPVSLDGHALSFEESVPVVVPDAIDVRDVDPGRVTVRIPLRVTLPNGDDNGSAPGGGPRRERNR